ncbi:MAG: NADH-quinone oxidoreductase subunit J [Planctomycetes bacterium]|nr:NADH-quinone oxidoreductase subunit J [Planctomycetota bacterium]
MEVLFVFCAIVALIGGVLCVVQRNAIYSLLSLLVSFAGTAGVFFCLDASFVAVSQILIYAGAIAVLFLFVLMFTDTRTVLGMGTPRVVDSRAVFNPDAKPEAGTRVKRFVLPNPLAALISLGVLAAMLFAIFKLPERFGKFGPLVEGEGLARDGIVPMVQFGSASGITLVTFQDFPLAFEVVSILIFAAVLGAVLLAKRHTAQATEPEPAVATEDE